MAEQISVNLKYKNPSTLVNDHLLPTTKAELVEESSAKQFISARQKAKIDEKQDKLGYVPIDKAGDTMTGALILDSGSITNPQQAVTKEYVDTKVANLVNSAPEALDTLYELAHAINNDPEYAVTMASAVGSKVDKSDTTTSGEANKIPYLSASGSLNANAATASKLKNAFRFIINGDVDTSTVLIDGSQNVTTTISIPQLTNDEITRIFNMTN